MAAWYCAIIARASEHWGTAVLQIHAYADTAEDLRSKHELEEYVKTEKLEIDTRRYVYSYQRYTTCRQSCPRSVQFAGYIDRYFELVNKLRVTWRSGTAWRGELARSECVDQRGTKHGLSSEGRWTTKQPSHSMGLSARGPFDCQPCEGGMPYNFRPKHCL